MERAEIKITNKLAELESVREWVEEFGAAHQLSPRVMTSLLVSFDEVLNNLISYGYSDERDHDIRLRLVLAGNDVWAEIEDDGVPFDPLTAPPPTLSGGIGERPVGGLGIHFLKTLNDEVTYRRQDNTNRLRFRKCLVDAPS
ncbi:MAG: ATP-binding protein [Betaproteobacteria bacterium]|jgi:anti-sigma regulatory factor (Ser/Thr protein kinase)|nr:ATP-binding protein [Betaproteobacteria bacterium]